MNILTVIYKQTLVSLHVVILTFTTIKSYIKFSGFNFLLTPENYENTPAILKYMNDTIISQMYGDWSFFETQTISPKTDQQKIHNSAALNIQISIYFVSVTIILFLSCL